MSGFHCTSKVVKYCGDPKSDHSKLGHARISDPCSNRANMAALLAIPFENQTKYLVRYLNGMGTQKSDIKDNKPDVFVIQIPKLFYY